MALTAAEPERHPRFPLEQPVDGMVRGVPVVALDRFSDQGDPRRCRVGFPDGGSGKREFLNSVSSPFMGTYRDE